MTQFTHIFDNIAKVKIFEVLVKETNNSVNISKLVQIITQRNYKYIKKYVAELERDKMIIIQKFGRIQIISINDNDNMARRLKTMLEILNVEGSYVNKILPRIERGIQK